ncbi:MAG: DUF3618 domain-containing protein [Gemmatimonadota bacterium]
MHDREEQAIRQRIEATRARMGETIEEIGDRVNPDRVQAELKARAREQVDEMKNNMKQKARQTMRDVEHEVSETGRGIWATIRENPVPAGMVGLGLAWLVANRSDSSRDHGYPAGTYRGYGAAAAVPYQPARDIGYEDRGRTAAGGIEGSHVAGTYTAGGYAYDAGRESGFSDGRDRSIGDEGGTMERVRERAAAAADSVREKAGHAADTVRERAGGAVDAVRGRVADVADAAHEGVDSAHYYARRTERKVEHVVYEHPVAAGAMAMAMGLAAGLMMPETRTEHELMGRARDRMLERASEAAQRAKERARETASEKLGDSAKQFIDNALRADDSSNRSGFSEPRR